MSLRLLTTSSGLPGLVSSITSHLVQPLGAACRTACIAFSRFFGVSARSSSYAAILTSAAACRSASVYSARDAALAFAIQMPLNPPTPTPCDSLNRRIPFSSAFVVSTFVMTFPMFFANSVVSSEFSASIASISSCSSRHRSHAVRAASASVLYSASSASSTSFSSCVLASIIVRVVSSGSPALSISVITRSVAATVAPPS